MDMDERKPSVRELRIAYDVTKKLGYSDPDSLVKAELAHALKMEWYKAMDKAKALEDEMKELGHPLG